MAKQILKEWDPSMSTDRSAPFNQGDYDGIQEEVQKILNDVYHVPGETMSFLKDSEIERYMDRYPGIEFINNELGDTPQFDKEVANLIYKDVYQDHYSPEAAKKQSDKWKQQEAGTADLYKGKKKLGEAKRRLLEEFPPLNEEGGAEDTKEEIVQLDQVQLFQDLAELDGSLSDAFAKFYVYKTQYIRNPNVKQALSKIRLSINELIKQVTNTMSGMGTLNDVPQEDTLDEI